MAQGEVDRFDVPVAGGPLAVFRFPGDGPVVVAAHGITGNYRSWAAVARALDGAVTLIVPDLRGRGRSNHLPGPFGMAAHAADLIAVLDHLGVEQSVMAGHSMGAYVVARLAVDHPERCAAAVLVDGGLTLRGSEGADPDTFLEAFLGPAVARLSMTFADRDAYRGFWHAHPAFAAADAGVSDDDLDAYADHDLVGSPPELRSSVNAAAVRGDGREIHAIGDAAHRLAVPASLLRADRGLLNEPNPMVPPDYAKQWLEEDPQRRTVAEVSATNHYSILMGKGAQTVADTIVRSAV